MSIFGVFQIGREALLANQRAMNVTSNNIANVDTPGYTRQRARFEATPPSYQGSFPLGGGVQVTEVERIADAALNTQMLREQQGLAYDERMELGLARVEGIFEELSGSGISTATTDLFRAMQDLANNPGGATEREALAQRGVVLGDLVRSADDRMRELQIDLNASVEQLVSDVNLLAGEIAQLNRQIFIAEGGEGSTAAALRDQRDQVLADLAGKIDFTTFERDDGQIAVFVAGGLFLVDAETSAGLEVRIDASSNPPRFEVFHNVSGSIAGPVTGLITGGELGAAIELRDVAVPRFRAELDRFAFSLADRVNQVHLAGFGLTDDVARRLFVDVTAPPTPPGTNFSAVAGAAGVFGLNPDLLADSQRIAAGATSLGPGQGAAASDNVNALALAAVEEQSAAMFRIGDPVAGPATGELTTLGAFFDSLVGVIGSEVQSSRRLVAQQDAVLAELKGRRDALSGVSLDEEIAMLIRLERSYQAGARVLSTADQVLEDLLRI